MKRVKKLGCTLFTADIQEKNLRFFINLGWEPIGPLYVQYGVRHQTMKADLSSVPGD